MPSDIVTSPSDEPPLSVLRAVSTVSTDGALPLTESLVSLQVYQMGFCCIYLVLSNNIFALERLFPRTFHVPALGGCNELPQNAVQ